MEESHNGVSRNGVPQNGISQNGISQNGILQNGISQNSVSRNSVSRQMEQSESDPDRSDWKNQLEGEAWQRFSREFLDLLIPQSSTGLSSFVFVRRFLAQFHLTNYFSEAYILNTVYIRAHRKIVTQGEAILNPQAWIRATAYNVVRELKRQQQRSIPLDAEVLDKQDRERSSVEETLEHELKLLRVAMAQLNAEDRRLIELKVMQELAWREIHYILQQEGIEIDLTALRKRKERAIARLRRIYHDLTRASGNPD